MKKSIVFILLSLFLISCKKEVTNPIQVKTAEITPYGGPVADTSKN